MTNIICEWCGEKSAIQKQATVYWELPDGTRAIEITKTPAITCQNCQMIYLSEEETKRIEDQLLLIDCSKIDHVISHKYLMEQPRLLKRNYFDFNE